MQNIASSLKFSLRGSLIVFLLLALIGCLPKEESTAPAQQTSTQLQLRIDGVNSLLGLDSVSTLSTLSDTDIRISLVEPTVSSSSFAGSGITAMKAVSRYAISPQPPVQLSFSTTTGEISGRVPNNFDQTFTITSYFADGTLGTATIRITTAGDLNELSLGPTHLCALVNASLFCSGNNRFGKLGLGNKFESNGVPGKLALTNVSMVKVQRNHSCAVKLDGTVWCWGLNSKGQLGNNATTDSGTPIEATQFGGNADDVALSQLTTCALLKDQTVACVGDGSEGRLGNGANLDSQVAVAVSGLTNVVQLVSGDYHFCARKADSTLWCWGMNYYGQLGQNNTAPYNIPVQMKDVAGTGNFAQVTDVQVGGYHTCFVNNAQAYCVGLNSYGQLGDGLTGTQSNLPKAVSGLTSGVSKIAAGDYHSCAIVSSSLYCWGRNNVGQLGDGTKINSAIPLLVSGLSGAVSEVWASGDVNPAISSTTCARDSVTVRCWGANQYAQISGIESPYWDANLVAALPTATAISMQASSLCALAAGEVYCKGLNDYNQLSTGVSAFRNSSMVKVPGLTSVTQLASGRYMVCAIKSDQSLMCWGYGGSGNFGNGATGSSATPVAANLAGVSAMAIGRHSACALKSDSTIWCFGGNYSGQVGDGTSTDQSSPVQVLSNAKLISMGDATACAVKNDNTIWCWGAGAYGALGNNASANSSIPVQVAGLPAGSISQLDVAANGACATVNSKLYCWGRDAATWSGGSGNSTSAVALMSSSNISKIRMKKSSWGGCAQTSGDQYYCFGNNFGKNFEDVRLDTINTPTLTRKIPSGTLDVAIGDSSSCYLTSIGQVSCWGFDTFGQAKDGSSGALTGKVVPGPFDVK